MLPLGQWLWYANLAALAGLLVRIHVTGLRRICPFLFTYFLMDAVASLILIRIPLYSVAYAHAYMVVQAVMHVLAILAVLELYRVALAKHPGLARFGRASVLAVTAFAIVVAAAGTFLDQEVLAGQSAINHRFFSLERTIELVILIFLLLIAAFITWFPVGVSRNISLSIAGFSVFYFTHAAGLLALNLLVQAYYPAVSSSLLGISLLCFTVWALVLRPEANASDYEAGHAGDPAVLARLTHQLDSINAALVRLGRR
ncbi:MAG TPA: hypothetical protein VGR73_01740 [Bryobacteraceae bacterium]|nr:hypothetical protein [Bryobacteraceae bacterium]